MAAEPTPAERRARRWSLAALLLLAPAALAAAGWRQAIDLAHGRELRVREVAAGEAADYAGATWRVSDFRVLADEPDPRLRTPPDRALALLRLKGRVARDIGEDWSVCQLTLVDGAGRRWRPGDVTLPRDLQRLIEPGGVSAPTCGSVAFSQPKAGAEVEFGAIYVVPRDALPTLRARFSVLSERPEALAFARP
ncbi:hypothetical protein ACFSCV_04280 [Methylopila henanensis]|uniref:DUF4352 domain-containing protein n=1 Tax=Methylopila henanensis TaxID=873516 RepID=A0ABW4K3H4_9HYPH